MIDEESAAIRNDKPLLPKNALLSCGETINWIAFQKDTDENLVGAACSDDCDPGVHHELEVLAGRSEPWREACLPGTPDWMTRGRSPEGKVDQERATALVARTGRDPGELADEMAPKLKYYGVRRSAWNAAMNEFIERVVTGELQPVLAPNAGAYSGRQSPGGFLQYQLIGVKPGWYERSKVLEYWPGPGPNAQEQPAPNEAVTKRGTKGLDYRAKDRCLVEEGVAGVQSGLFKNATDAGRALADRAAGGGTRNSKGVRLAKQIKACLGPD